MFRYWRNLKAGRAYEQEVVRVREGTDCIDRSLYWATKCGARGLYVYTGPDVGPVGKAHPEKL